MAGSYNTASIAALYCIDLGTPSTSFDYDRPAEVIKTSDRRCSAARRPVGRHRSTGAKRDGDGA